MPLVDHAIHVEKVNFFFGSRQILDNVSFSVSPGKIHGFLGPNGAGKSTMMRIMTGIYPAQLGEVLMEGEKMGPQAYELKNQIGFLPENPPLYDDMLVDEYLNFVGNLRGIKGEKLKKAKNFVCERLELIPVKKRLIGNLSKGYRQRLGFAQALLHSPKILILDEPTLGLDPWAIVKMRELILELSGSHTIFLSSHQLGEVEKICHELTLLHLGKILVTGNLQKLQKDQNLEEFFLEKVREEF